MGTLFVRFQLVHGLVMLGARSMRTRVGPLPQMNFSVGPQIKIQGEALPTTRKITLGKVT